ncbi:MAG: BamA/TamA family outer membrane protein, partial [Gammaproteobacteria bacterium]|nr:BamA/TamA family outer membrane protein [Gammaproteobacteria bacterium]
AMAMFAALGGNAKESANDKDTADEEKPSHQRAKGKFVPIPIFITEPAIGEGLGAVLAYFHPPRNPDEEREDDGKDSADKSHVATLETISETGDGTKAPPIVSGIAGGYASSGTWGAGIGHSNNWRDDSIRYVGTGGYANLNADIYVSNRPVSFNLKGALVTQDLKFRVGDSDFFVGGALNYQNGTAEFLSDILPPGLLDFELVNVGLAARGLYDTRDDALYPRKGRMFDLSIGRYDERFGGDFDYWNSRLKLHSFHSLTQKFVLGLRLDLWKVAGDPPFFAFPWISMRGVQAMRYQGEYAVSAEVEGRYYVAKRWTVSAFVGHGVAGGDSMRFESESINAVGVGFRFKLFKDNNIWAGADIARSPGQTAYYIQVGQAW